MSHLVNCILIALVSFFGGIVFVFVRLEKEYPEAYKIIGSKQNTKRKDKIL